MNTQIPEIGAEMLLGYLYPELDARWTARCEGTFYRNYNPDILELDPEAAEVSLSRDGLLDLLPQGVLSPEDDLRKDGGGHSHEEVESRLKVLREAFLPFDSLVFRDRLRAERSVSELVDGKLEYVLKTYFGFDLAAEQNPYVREFAALLPGIRRWRGDFGLLRQLLAAMFRCEVALTERRYSETDSTKAWLPAVRYELLKPGLTAAEVQALYRDLQPLTDFLQEWFMPLELRLEIVVRQRPALSGQVGDMTLDYNTEL